MRPKNLTLSHSTWKVSALWHRNSCKDYISSKRCDRMGSWMWSKAKHCIKVCYSKLQNSLGPKVNRQLVSSLVPNAHLKPMCPRLCQKERHRNERDSTHLSTTFISHEKGEKPLVYFCLRYSWKLNRTPTFSLHKHILH